jgi:hypothetical protein
VPARGSKQRSHRASSERTACVCSSARALRKELTMEYHRLAQMLEARRLAMGCLGREAAVGRQRREWSALPGSPSRRTAPQLRDERATGPAHRGYGVCRGRCVSGAGGGRVAGTVSHPQRAGRATGASRGVVGCRRRR